MDLAVRREIEDLIVSGRGKTEDEFDGILDKYFKDKTETDKNEVGEALSDFFSDRISQFIEVENRITRFEISQRYKNRLAWSTSPVSAGV